MSSNYKVRLRRYNGTDYDTLNLSSQNIIMNNGSNVEDTINSIETNLDLINKIYPVGSIYFSVSNSINPSTYFVGTTWRKIEEGRFLLSSGTNYSLNSKGGEASHQLTIDELPRHTHGLKELVGYFFSRLARQGLTSFVWANAEGLVSWRHSAEEFNDVAVVDVSMVSGQRSKPDFFTVNASHEHSPVGDNKAHNNMPPYLVVNMWERIS